MSAAEQFNPVPNCDYVHEQANRMNEARDTLQRFRAYQPESSLQVVEGELRLADLTQQISDDILEREFLQPDDSDDPLRHIHSGLLSISWRLENLNYSHAKRALEADSTENAILERTQGRYDAAQAKIDTHAARWHAFGNVACDVTEEWMPPITEVGKTLRIAAGIALQKMGFKRP